MSVRNRSLGRRFGRFGAGAFTAGALALLYVPVAVLIVFSFNKARTGSKWAGFTTEWYGSIGDDRQLMAALRNTLTIAGVATVVSTALAVMIALGMERTSFRTKPVAERILNLPVINAEIITGVSLLAGYSLVLQGLNDVLGRSPADALRFGRWSILLAHVAFCTAFAVMIVRTSLRGLDPALDEASVDLGATRWQTFWKVTLPAIAPGVVGGALMAFTLSIDNFVITFFVSGPGSTTLPIEIFARLRRTVGPEINAVATLIFLGSVLVLSTAVGLQAFVDRRRSRPVSVLAPDPTDLRPALDSGFDSGETQARPTTPTGAQIP